MNLSDAIEALATATLADGRSQRTANDYRQKLTRLLGFLGDVDVATITAQDLRNYVAAQRAQRTRYANTTARPEIAGGLATASIAGYVRAVKRLFRWLVDEGVLASNPAARLKTPAAPRGEPKAYTRRDLRDLLRATAGDDPMQRRDRALLLVLADTGCRVGGLAGLRIADLDLDQQRARVTEKGGRSRWVYFTSYTSQALRDWLAVHPDPAGGILWSNLGTVGAPGLTVEGIRQVLKRLGQRAGVQGPVNPHAFRHGFAREYLLAGGDLASLADLLGHSSVEVTWRYYAIFAEDELAEKHHRHSPVTRLADEEE